MTAHDTAAAVEWVADELCEGLAAEQIHGIIFETAQAYDLSIGEYLAHAAQMAAVLVASYTICTALSPGHCICKREGCPQPDPGCSTNFTGTSLAEFIAWVQSDMKAEG